MINDKAVRFGSDRYRTVAIKPCHYDGGALSRHRNVAVSSIAKACKQTRLNCLAHNMYRNYLKYIHIHVHILSRPENVVDFFSFRD